MTSHELGKCIICQESDDPTPKTWMISSNGMLVCYRCHHAAMNAKKTAAAPLPGESDFSLRLRALADRPIYSGPDLVALREELLALAAESER